MTFMKRAQAGQRKMFPSNKTNRYKIQVLFANLFINTNFNEIFCSDLRRLLSTEAEALDSKSRPQMLLYMDSVFIVSIFADKTNLDIKGGGAGGIAVVEGAIGVEGSAVHDAEDDGETDNEEHL